MIRHPDQLSLWVFEENRGARKLYERFGFVVVERTDGSGNEERQPDLRMQWGR
jgi:ribosomal protein S18 acetylase RimI-like enzyme